MSYEIALRVVCPPAILEQKNYTDPVVMHPWQKKDVINAGNDALQKTMSVSQLSFIASADVLEHGSRVAIAGAEAAALGAGRLTRGVLSETLKQTNRYTSDIYDIGNNGKGDFSKDAVLSFAGHSAMLAQNGVRLARIPTRYAIKGTHLILYNQARMKKAEIRKQLFHKTDSGIDKRYNDILSGYSHKDVIRYSDRLAWNRYVPNEMKGLSLEDKSKLMTNKYRAQSVDRMQGRSNFLKKMDKGMKQKQFSAKRALKGTASNQIRKTLNKATAGDGFEQKTFRSAMRVGQGIGASWPLIKKAKYLYQIARHPIQSFKGILNGIGKAFNAVKGFVMAIPVVVSVIAICLPAIFVVLFIAVIIMPGGLLEIQDRYNQNSIQKIATPEYAANAFIYEAKERGWKDNAIVGVLSYMIQEGCGEGGMGTFTYEGVHDYKFTGPQGKEYDKTLDNDAWRKWLRESGKTQGQKVGKAAIGLGLLQDSDTWNGDGTRNASSLIDEADKYDQPWQDPRTQMKWIFDVRCKVGVNAFDDNHDNIAEPIDPTKHDFSPKEWCQRITCGIGMPGWTVISNGESLYVKEHYKHLETAQNYLNNYRNFTYLSIHGGSIDGDPDFSNNDAWRTGNPFYPTYTGQCTWFAWGRFYEIYGYDPGFRGNGDQNVQELLSTHPDKFKFSTTPAPGALFSSPNPHVGIVTAVGSDTITVQEGNLNGKTDSFEVAITDWHTKTYRMSDFLSAYGSVTYAIPI